MLQLRSYDFDHEAEPTYIYSHLVYASKFAMPPISHNVHTSYPTFELSNESLQLIQKALEDLRVLNVDMCLQKGFKFEPPSSTILD